MNLKKLRSKGYTKLIRGRNSSNPTTQRGEKKMAHQAATLYKFYDMKAKASVELAPTERLKTANGKHMLKAKTADGRTVCSMVSKDTFDIWSKVPVGK